MIVLLEEPESWSLMMLVSSQVIDNAGISEEAKEAIRKWRAACNEKSAEMAKITDGLNGSLNARIDAKFMRRIKSTGYRAETVRK